LSLLYAVETRSVEKQFFSRVGWSADGNWLYAGGWYDVQGTNHIRRWADGGQGAATDLPVTENSITLILTLTVGKMVFAASDPAFGVLDAAGQRQLFQGPTGADFRADWRDFRVSHDGATVQFSYQRRGGAPARFALRDRLLTLQSAEDPSLTRPVTSVPGLSIA